MINLAKRCASCNRNHDILMNQHLKQHNFLSLLSFIEHDFLLKKENVARIPVKL